MPRFLSLLLVAVAAGVADAVCESWCHQCAHCFRPPFPPSPAAPPTTLPPCPDARQTRAFTTRLAAAPARSAIKSPRAPTVPRGVTITPVRTISAKAARRATTWTLVALAASTGAAACPNRFVCRLRGPTVCPVARRQRAGAWLCPPAPHGAKNHGFTLTCTLTTRCNSYTCGDDNCKTCNGMGGAPNCVDQTTFCEGWYDSPPQPSPSPLAPRPSPSPRR